MLFRPIRADTIRLKDGTVYENVKSYPRANSHRIQFLDGRVLLVPNEKIAKVRLSSVHWPKPTRKSASIKKKKQLPKASSKAVLKARPKPEPNTNAKAAPKSLHRVSPEDSPWPKPQENWKLRPVWKSLAVPGWGQYSEGQKWKGLAFFAGSLVLLNDYRQKRRLHAQAQKDYSEVGTPLVLAGQGLNGYLFYLGILEQKKSVLLRRERQTNQRVLALSALWGWNVLDVLLLSNPWIVKKYPFLGHLDLELKNMPGTDLHFMSPGGPASALPSAAGRRRHLSVALRFVF